MKHHLNELCKEKNCLCRKLENIVIEKKINKRKNSSVKDRSENILLNETWFCYNKTLISQDIYQESDMRINNLKTKANKGHGRRWRNYTEQWKF